MCEACDASRDRLAALMTPPKLEAARTAYALVEHVARGQMLDAESLIQMQTDDEMRSLLRAFSSILSGTMAFHGLDPIRWAMQSQQALNVLETHRPT